MSDQRSGASDSGADHARLDDLGAASFPASDPPQSWTWEPGAGRDRPAPAAPPLREVAQDTNQGS